MSLAAPAIVTAARAAAPIDAEADFGVAANAGGDQTAKLQQAIDAAAAAGRVLRLPGGGVEAEELRIPGGLQMVGTPGTTILTAPHGKRVALVSKADWLSVDGIVFQANAPDGADGVQGLVEIEQSSRVSFTRCGFYNGAANGIAVTTSDLHIDDCDFEGHVFAAIHAQDANGITVRDSRIADCGDAGIRVWRSKTGPDASLLSGNRIGRIDWKSGGNGQNGNGISLYQADGVIVSDNRIADCAFSAIRVNGCNDTQIRGNTCLRSGEVAIFSEFAFSGSVIAGNIVDGAATGISITNLDSGGRLATCTGNIVRNIVPRSAVNPDTRPVGIYAEAGTVISGNTVDTVPGIGIAAGYGPFVRNLVVSDNVVSGADTGIAVSVVQQQPAGAVRASGNIISGARHGIVGMEWEKTASDDLARDGARYPNIVVEGNSFQ